MFVCQSALCFQSLHVYIYFTVLTLPCVANITFVLSVAFLKSKDLLCTLVIRNEVQGFMLRKQDTILSYIHIIWQVVVLWLIEEIVSLEPAVWREPIMYVKSKASKTMRSLWVTFSLHHHTVDIQYMACDVNVWKSLRLFMWWQS